MPALPDSLFRCPNFGRRLGSRAEKYYSFYSHLRLEVLLDKTTEVNAESPSLPSVPVLQNCFTEVAR